MNIQKTRKVFEEIENLSLRNIKITIENDVSLYQLRVGFKGGHLSMGGTIFELLQEIINRHDLVYLISFHSNSIIIASNYEG